MAVSARHLALGSPVRRSRVSDEIAHRIRELIVSGDLKPGERVGAERELAQRLNTSRAAVAGALRILEREGLVTTRHGSGTCVREAAIDPAVDSLALLLRRFHTSPGELFHARYVIEPVIARLAADRITSIELLELHRITTEMRAALGDTDRLVELDVQFHQSLSEASRNTVLGTVLASLWPAIRELIHYRMLTVVHAGREFTERHLDIVTPLAARDANGAEAAIRLHLQRHLRALGVGIDGLPHQHTRRRIVERDRTASQPMRRKGAG